MSDELPILPASAIDRPRIKVDASAIAYALARNECGEKLHISNALVALGLDPTDPSLRVLLMSEAFKKRYAGFVAELKANGESFKLKARVQAEELLKTQWEIIQDKAAPHAVRMKGIENVVEWADLKPRKAVENTAPTQISITIDLGGERPEVIDVTPEKADAVSLQSPADSR